MVVNASMYIQKLGQAKNGKCRSELSSWRDTFQKSGGGNGREKKGIREERRVKDDGAQCRGRQAIQNESRTTEW